MDKTTNEYWAAGWNWAHDQLSHTDMRAVFATAWSAALDISTERPLPVYKGICDRLDAEEVPN